MRWRPEGWRPMFTEEQIKEGRGEHIRLNLQFAYEEGADAMLEALRKSLAKSGIYLPNDEVKNETTV